MSGTAMSAAAFINLEGINADLAFSGGQGGQITGYTNVSLDLSELLTLGITQIRTFLTNAGATLPNGAPPAAYDGSSSSPLSSYEMLAAAGIKFDFIIANGPMTAAQVLGYIEMAAEINAAYPGSVIGIEGVNESNNNSAITFTDANGNVTTGDAAALAMQRAIYADVQATPALAGVTVVDYTTDSTFGSALDPNPATTSGVANVANFHEYADQGYPGNPGVLIPYIAEAPNAVDEPVDGAGETWVTEWGYPLYPGNSAGVTEPVAGAYQLDTIMDYAKSGTKNFLYGLNEDSNYFGEYYSNGALTTEGQDVANLNAIIKATAGSTAPTINATANLSALTDGNMMQVGSDLVVWAEPELLNQTTGASAYPLPSPINVTVQLGGAYYVAEYDPTVGIAATTALADVTSVTVGVAASPIILSLTAVSGSGGGGSGDDSTGNTIIGSGTATIDITVTTGNATTPFTVVAWDNAEPTVTFTWGNVTQAADTTVTYAVEGSFAGKSVTGVLANIPNGDTVTADYAVYQGVTTDVNEALTNQIYDAFQVNGAATPSTTIIGQPGTFITTAAGGTTVVHLQGGSEQVQAQGTDTIDVGTGTGTVYANTDTDSVTINGGAAGSSGLYLLGTGGRVNEGAGTDSTKSYNGGMTFVGGSGIDTVSLVAGGNTITAGSGALIVYANTTGSNSFVFDQSGSTTIYGLNTTSDIVDLSAFGLSPAGLAADTTFNYAGMLVSVPSSGGAGATNIIVAGITSAAEIHFKLE